MNYDTLFVQNFFTILLVYCFSKGEWKVILMVCICILYRCNGKCTIFAFI